MKPAFLSNTIWFILLGVLTAVEILIILVKAKNRKAALALFCTVSGMTFTYEAIICCFLKAYNYYPMIFPQSPFDDYLAGNLFSQFCITATALMIAVLNLKNYWILIIAAVYGVVEELFLYLGIYSHNWYQTWMTVVGLILLFTVTRKIYKSTFKPLGHMLRYTYIFFGLYTLHMPSITWAFKLTGILAFNMGIIPDPLSSYAMLALAVLFFLSITCMFIYFSKLKWLWKLMLTLTIYIVFNIASILNLIYIKEGWFFIYTTISFSSMFLFIYILDKLYNGKSDWF